MKNRGSLEACPVASIVWRVVTVKKLLECLILVLELDRAVCVSPSFCCFVVN